MKLHFDIKLFSYLFFCFILFTVIGTLSHELGHKFAGTIVGIKSYVNYCSTCIISVSQEVNKSAVFIFTLGGPLQTMFTGFVGFLLIYFRRVQFWQTDRLSAWQWFLVFVALFWLRQAFNFAIELIDYFNTGSVISNADEVKIAEYLSLPNLSLSFVSALIAILGLTHIFFTFIPTKQKFTFVISGLFGGLFGFYLWFTLLGPVLMP